MVENFRSVGPSDSSLTSRPNRPPVRPTLHPRRFALTPARVSFLDETVIRGNNKCPGFLPHSNSAEAACPLPVCAADAGRALAGVRELHITLRFYRRYRRPTADELVSAFRPDRTGSSFSLLLNGLGPLRLPRTRTRSWAGNFPVPPNSRLLQAEIARSASATVLPRIRAASAAM